MPKNAFAPDPAGEAGAYSAPPGPLAVNGGGPPGRGKERKRRGGKRRGGEGRGKRVGREGVGRKGEGLSPRTKILATALLA